MANQRPGFGKVSRHPAVVALFSVVLGTWMFGQYDYLQKSRDSRREKSVAFLEETSKNFNGVLTDIFLCTQTKKRPADDSLRKSCNDLFKQRLVVAIKSEAFLQSPAFSDEYYRVARELEETVALLYQPDPQYDQVQAKALSAWQATLELLSNALSDAMRQPNGDFGSRVFFPGTAGMLLLLAASLILAFIFWKRRKRTSNHGPVPK